MLHEIDSDLKKAEATLTHWAMNYPQVIKDAARTSVEFETAWADAIKQITDAVPEGQKQPTVAVLEAEATRICAEELKAKKMAEAEAEIAKKLIGIAETTLTSIQTRASLEKMEVGLSGYRT